MIPLILAAALAAPIDLSTVPADERAKAAAAVAVYPPSRKAPEATKVLGDVAATSCVGVTSGDVPSLDDAMLQLQLKAYRMGATAVVSLAYRNGSANTPWTKCHDWVSAQGIAVTTN